MLPRLTKTLSLLIALSVVASNTLDTLASGDALVTRKDKTTSLGSGKIPSPAIAGKSKSSLVEEDSIVPSLDEVDIKLPSHGNLKTSTSSLDGSGAITPSAVKTEDPKSSMDKTKSLTSSKVIEDVKASPEANKVKDTSRSSDEVGNSESKTNSGILKTDNDKTTAVTVKDLDKNLPPTTKMSLSKVESTLSPTSAILTSQGKKAPSSPAESTQQDSSPASVATVGDAQSGIRSSAIKADDAAIMSNNGGDKTSSLVEKNTGITAIGDKTISKTDVTLATPAIGNSAPLLLLSVDDHKIPVPAVSIVDKPSESSADLDKSKLSLSIVPEPDFVKSGPSNSSETVTSPSTPNPIADSVLDFSDDARFTVPPLLIALNQTTSRDPQSSTASLQNSENFLVDSRISNLDDEIFAEDDSESTDTTDSSTPSMDSDILESSDTDISSNPDNTVSSTVTPSETITELNIDFPVSEPTDPDSILDDGYGESRFRSLEEPIYASEDDASPLTTVYDQRPPMYQQSSLLSDETTSSVVPPSHYVPPLLVPTQSLPQFRTPWKSVYTSDSHGLNPVSASIIPTVDKASSPTMIPLMPEESMALPVSSLDWKSDGPVRSSVSGYTPKPVPIPSSSSTKSVHKPPVIYPTSDIPIMPTSKLQYQPSMDQLSMEHAPSSPAHYHSDTVPELLAKPPPFVSSDRGGLDLKSSQTHVPVSPTRSNPEAAPAQTVVMLTPWKPTNVPHSSRTIDFADSLRSTISSDPNPYQSLKSNVMLSKIADSSSLREPLQERPAASVVSKIASGSQQVGETGTAVPQPSKSEGNGHLGGKSHPGANDPALDTAWLSLVLLTYSAPSTVVADSDPTSVPGASSSRPLIPSEWPKAVVAAKPVDIPDDSKPFYIAFDEKLNYNFVVQSTDSSAQIFGILPHVLQSAIPGLSVEEFQVQNLTPQDSLDKSFVATVAKIIAPAKYHDQLEKLIKDPTSALYNNSDSVQRALANAIDADFDKAKVTPTESSLTSSSGNPSALGLSTVVGSLGETTDSSEISKPTHTAVIAVGAAAGSIIYLGLMALLFRRVKNSRKSPALALSDSESGHSSEFDLHFQFRSNSSRHMSHPSTLTHLNLGSTQTQNYLMSISAPFKATNSLGWNLA